MSQGQYISYPQTIGSGSSGGGGGGGGPATSIAFSVGSLDGQSPSANAASVSSASLFMQSASASDPGIVNTTTQTLAGDKTFSGSVTRFTNKGYFGTADGTVVANANPSVLFNSTIQNHTVAIFTGPNADGALALITVNNGSFYIQGVASNDGTGSTAQPIYLNPQGGNVNIGTAPGTVILTGFGSGPVRSAAGVLSVGSVSLVNEVTGSLSATTITPIVPKIVAIIDLTGQSASVGSTSTGVTPSGDHLYRVSAFTSLTTPASVSSTLPSTNVAYIDADSNTLLNKVLSVTSAANTVPTTPALISFFKAKSGTPIRYFTNGYATVGTTSMQYAAHWVLEQMD